MLQFGTGPREKNRSLRWQALAARWSLHCDGWFDTSKIDETACRFQVYIHFHARFWRSLVLQMDLQFAVDDTVPRLDFLCVCYRWSKRSPVPSSCCQCQDASSYISWFSIAQCDFAPFGVGPSQSVPGDTACRNFWRNSALVSQTVTTMAGKSYQRMSEREREKQQKEYNHYNFRVVFWSLCCLAVRSGTLAFFELLLFRKVCRNSSKENCKKTVLDWIGMFWFQIACDSGIEEIPTWLPREGHQVLLEAAFISFHIIRSWSFELGRLNQRRILARSLDQERHEAQRLCGAVEGTDGHGDFSIDLFVWINSYKAHRQFDQADIVSYWIILFYCIISNIYCYFLLGSAMVILSVSSSLSFRNPLQSHGSDEQQGGWSHVAREVVDWSRERQTFAQNKRSAESRKEWMNIHDYSCIGNGTIVGVFHNGHWKTMEKSGWQGIYKINWRDLSELNCRMLAMKYEMQE